MNRPADPDLRRKLDRYNQWEQVRRRQQSPEASFLEFCHLYELIVHLDPQQINQGHEAHLADLVAVNKRLKIKD
jgi:hypothetical protein